MLISQPISRCLTNHSELCMSRLLNNQPRRISIYRLQRWPSFAFESSVSSTPMTSGDPVVRGERAFRNLCNMCYRVYKCTIDIDVAVDERGIAHFVRRSICSSVSLSVFTCTLIITAMPWANCLLSYNVSLLNS